MNRLSKNVSLVLVSSSLALGGCEESYSEHSARYEQRPPAFTTEVTEKPLKAEKEEDPQNSTNTGTQPAGSPGSQIPNALGTTSSSAGSSSYSSSGNISHGGFYHPMPILYSGRGGMGSSTSTTGISSTSSSSSPKGVSSVSGGVSSTSSRGGFGSSAHGASSS